MQTINIIFPLEDDTDNSRLFKLNTVTKNALKSDLLLLLLTSVGERYYRPDYGTNLIKYLFQPDDTVTVSEIEAELKQTVKKFIPQLTVNNVVIDENKQPNTILLKISFTYNESAFSEDGVVEIVF